MVTTRQTKKNLKPLPAGKTGKSRNPSTLRRHRYNAERSAHEAERIRALNALRTLKSRKRKAATKMKEIQGMSEDQREKWIENYVERETQVARQRVEAADAAVNEDMENEYGAPPAVRTKKRTFEELLALVGDDLDNVVPSDDDDDDDDEEEPDEDEDEKEWADDDDFVPGQMDKTTMAEIAAARARTSRIFELTKEGYAEAEAFWRKRDEEVGVDTLKHGRLPVPRSETEKSDEMEAASPPIIGAAGRTKRSPVSAAGDQREIPARKRSKLVCTPAASLAWCRLANCW
jgi:hypothetical protein